MSRLYGRSSVHVRVRRPHGHDTWRDGPANWNMGWLCVPRNRATSHAGRRHAGVDGLATTIEYEWWLLGKNRLMAPGDPEKLRLLSSACES